MKTCDEYQEMISAYIDGELTDGDSSELKAHLETCEKCRETLNVYREITVAVAEGTADVPDGFSEDVMRKINNVPETSSHGKISIITRWACIAACIAIVVLVSPHLPNLGCGASVSTDSSSTLTMTMDSDTAADGDSRPALTENTAESASESASDSASEYSGDSETENTEDAYYNGYSKEDYSMVIIVHGDIPEILKNIQPDSETGDNKYWITDTDSAQELLKGHSEYASEILDEGKPYALVIASSSN